MIYLFWQEIGIWKTARKLGKYNIAGSKSFIKFLSWKAEPKLGLLQFVSVTFNKAKEGPFLS